AAFTNPGPVLGLQSCQDCQTLYMERWQHIPGPALPGSMPSELDFMQAFRQLRIPPPRDDVRSSGLKQISTHELHASGPSLQELRSLDLDTFHLAQEVHTRHWARDSLSHHGPVLTGMSWNPATLRLLSTMPIMINDEFNVVEYLKTVFMGPVACGATCLFQISCQPGDAPLGFPSAVDGRAIQSRAMSGQSGRPDAEVLWNFQTCVALEVKTHKATTLNNPTLSDVLQKLGDGWSEWAPAMRENGA
ncbi:hypothetical protein BDR05DRAFT_954225, partial [Suillus weaverae]